VSEELTLARGDDDDMKVKALEFYVPPGTKVWVKVVEVTPDPAQPGRSRVHGSIKLVSQADGRDLDPSGALAAAAAGPGGGGGGGGPGGPGGPRRGGQQEPPEVNSIHHATARCLRCAAARRSLLAARPLRSLPSLSLASLIRLFFDSNP